MSARRVLVGGLAAAAAAATTSALAPSAVAAPTVPPSPPADATWTGGSTASNLWNDPANWGGTTPTSPIGNLTFGDLPACDAGTAPAGSSCYSGYDNLGYIYANELVVGGKGFYNFYPSSNSDFIQLQGNGQSPNVGLVAMPNGNQQIANITVPIELGSDQTWQVGSGGVSGYGNLYLGGMGQAHNLTLDLNNGWVEADDVETYAGTNPNSNTMTVQGPGEFQLNYSPNYALRRLPAVTVQDSANGSGTALGVATPGATSGSINITGTDNNFIVLTNHAPGETTLAVTGNVTLDGTTNMEFDIDGNNTTPGVDSSQLTATGTVAFNGAKLSLWQALDNGNCDVLTPGTSYTLLKAGSLTGQLTVGGKTISAGQSATEAFSADHCPNASSMTARVDYGTSTITATVLGVQAGTQAPQISGTAQVGDTLSVSNNGSWTAQPTPTYAYQWYACASGSCSPISGATGSRLTLTSAETGKTVQVKVTANNGYGSASALSNVLGPVKAAPVTTTTTTPTTTTPTTTTPTTTQPTPTPIKPALAPLIRAQLRHLAHPHGRHAIRMLIRHRMFRTHFRAPSSGVLTVVWRAHLTIRRHGHVRHLTFVIARGHARPHAAGRVMLKVHLTRAGRRALHRHPFGLHTSATERFRAPSTGWNTLTRRFRL